MPRKAKSPTEETTPRTKRAYHKGRKGKPRVRHNPDLPWPRWLRPRINPELPVISPRNLRVFGLFMATFDEACALFGCSSATLADLMRECPELRQAWDEGQRQSRHSLRRRQLDVAYSDTPQAATMLIHLGKTVLGQSERTRHEHTGADGGPVRYSHIRRTIVIPATEEGGHAREIDVTKYELEMERLTASRH